MFVCRFLQVHPECGNCRKTGTQCTYDAPDSQDVGDDGQQHARKRRRGDSQPSGDDTVDVQGTSEIQRPDSQDIQARLEKLKSMIEKLNDNPNQTLDLSERQYLAQSGEFDSNKRDFMGGGIRSPRRPADSSGDDFPVPSGRATDLVDPVGSMNLGHLSLEDGGKSR